MNRVLSILALLALSCCAAPNLVVPKPEPAQDTCVAKRLSPAANTAALRLWGQQSKLWPQRSTLRVQFVHGTRWQQDRAWYRFQCVDKLINLTFVRVSTGPAEIRVAFAPGGGHYSWVGRDNLSIVSVPTMNIELDRFDGSREWTRVGAHEVLHAVGLEHEHQHPLWQVPWNFPVVFSDYLREQGWDEATTRYQVTDRPVVRDLVGSAPDTKSLMLYPIPARHVLDPSFAVGWNYKLSDLDKETLRRLYP